MAGWLAEYIEYAALFFLQLIVIINPPPTFALVAFV
jgi:hypothetical protein